MTRNRLFRSDQGHWHFSQTRNEKGTEGFARSLFLFGSLELGFVPFRPGIRSMVLSQRSTLQLV